MFIVSLIYTAPLEEVDRHLDEHVSYLKRQYAAGSFVASGRKIPRTGGVILSKLENRATLDAILEQDPFRRAGVADYEVIEFDPSMVAEGFEILQ
ncbi:YciI family protein [Acidihalobacter prosperus]